jgi:hypothetical protein
MSENVMPVISAQDFAGFKDVLGAELTISYDDWLKLSYAYGHPDHHAEDEYPVPVEIKPAGFEDFLKSHPEHRNIRGLLAYARALAKDRA